MPSLHHYLSALREEEGVEDDRYDDDAELFLRGVERVVRMRRGQITLHGEEDMLHRQGDEDDNDDDHHHPGYDDQQSQTRKAKLTALTTIAAYQPRLTQPLWMFRGRVGKDGHLAPLDDGLPEQTAVINDGDVATSWWWLTIVYYYFSLSLFGVLVLAYSFVFTSIALNRLS